MNFFCFFRNAIKFKVNFVFFLSKFFLEITMIYFINLISRSINLTPYP